MPYVIALVIIIVAAGALLLFNQQAEAPVVLEETARVEADIQDTLPEGYTPPTEQPPSLNPGGEDASLETDTGTTADELVTPEVAPESVAAPSETYMAEASYFTPRRTEHDIAVTLELDGTTIVDANVTYDGGPASTPAHSGFDGAYASEAIGQNINNLELSRTGGASLTAIAFNEAVAEIRAQL
jgi:hypothetical protein